VGEISIPIVEALSTTEPPEYIWWQSTAWLLSTVDWLKQRKKRKFMSKALGWPNSQRVTKSSHNSHNHLSVVFVLHDAQLWLNRCNWKLTQKCSSFQQSSSGKSSFTFNSSKSHQSETFYGLDDELMPNRKAHIFRHNNSPPR